jgi:hypothetical protein
MKREVVGMNLDETKWRENAPQFQWDFFLCDPQRQRSTMGNSISYD